RFTAAEHLRHPAALIDDNVVLFEYAVGSGVAISAEHLGNVLVQRAAEGNVEHLQPSADAEKWHSRFDGCEKKRGLPLVAVVARLVRRRQRLLAVSPRVHIFA